MRIATDIGGTFTDLVYLNETTGEVGTTKVSTTPAHFAQGVVNTLLKAKVPVADTTYFVHGSTVVINALTERKGVKTGLITTKGFRDVLEIQRTNRPDIYNFYYTKPKPFVPRYLRLEVDERIKYTGEVLTPLNANDVERAVAALLREGIQAIAVCFLHSYANPVHEIECSAIISRLAPDLPVTLSHQVTQEWREYERTNSAVLNSYVLPIGRAYLGHLERSLAEMGMGQVLHVMQSNGGSTTFEVGKRLPINLVESGPVGGVIGAAAVGELIGESNIISLDIGGTTAKASLVEGSTPKITTEYRIERRRDYAGYPILVPTVDIVEIGAGGGSIAWIDDAGALRVGPVSAGADPGPACYALGGEQPTVTDANVLAGRINPEYFLGGEIQLNLERARAAMQPIATASQMNVEEAALGVIRLAEASLVNALKLVSVRRGYDPRDFALIAFGGGGAMHAAALMRELRVKKTIIPREPAVFSAWGMLMTDLRRDYLRTHITRLDQVDPVVFTRAFEDLEAQAMTDLHSDHVSREGMVFKRFADIRYLGQEHTVKVSLPAGRISAEVMPEIAEMFHRLHEHTYTFRLDVALEVVNYHLTAFGRVNKPKIQRAHSHGHSVATAHKGTRRVNFSEFGFQAAELYERSRLPVGEAIRGPAVIEEPTATTVVFPDQKITSDEYGLLHIEPQ